jgi:hypothetical protein
MVSLEAALKNAIQVQFQLEDNELATDLLPNNDDPAVILLYESAEGGAGVLRRLLDDPEAFAQVARRAAERATEDCEAACYDCLMHYGNQPDHRHLDRKKNPGNIDRVDSSAGRNGRRWTVTRLPP